MANPNDVLVPVDELPPSLMAGLDPDGLPRTDPAPEAPKIPLIPVKVSPRPAETAKAPEPTPGIDPTVFADARRENQAMRQEIERMQQRLEEETAKREKSDQFGSYRTAQALQQAAGQRQAKLDGIDAQLSAFKASQQAARNALAQAKAAGDVAAEIAATEAMQGATSALSQLEAAKVMAKDDLDQAAASYREAVEDYNRVAAEAAKKAEKKPEPPAQRPAQTPDDWIAQFPRKMANWLHGHKDFVTDKGKHEQLMGFINSWVDDWGAGGLQTPQFVDALESKFGAPAAPKQPDPPAAQAPDVEVETEPPRHQPSASAVAAPVSRSSTPAKASGPVGTVRLTAEQAAIAPHLYPELSETDARKQYALDLLKAHADKRFEPRS